MIKTQITIINKLGLHARAAAKFVATTSAFASSIRTGKSGRLVDAKSIMQVMMLAAAKDTVLDFEIEGEDEHEALAAITKLINNYFDEGE